MKYRKDNGRVLTARVAAWHDDPAEALRAYYGKRDVQIEVISFEPAELARIESAVARKPDRIERETTDLNIPAREAYLYDLSDRIEKAGRSATLGYLEFEMRRGKDVERLAVQDDESEIDHFENWWEKICYFDAVSIPVE